MILSIGEILADVIVGEDNSSLQMEAHLGGAPLNVAVNAARAGADVAFTGRVGRDVIGKFLIRQAKKTGLAKLDIRRLRKSKHSSLGLFDAVRKNRTRICP